MEGGISLKKFILGVKRELQEASTEGSENPFLELTQVELEAEFNLEATGTVEGGFSIFVKASAGGSTSQSHKVKLIFSPLSADDTIVYGDPPSPPPDQPPDQLTDPTSGDTSSQKGESVVIIVPPPGGRSERPSRRPGIYFQMPKIVFDPKIDIDEIVKEALLKAEIPIKKTRDSE